MGWEDRSMQIRLGMLKQTMKINMKVRKKKEKQLVLENWQKNFNDRKQTFQYEQEE